MNRLVALVLCLCVLSGCSSDLIRDCDRTMVPINAPAVVGRDEPATDEIDTSEPDTE